MENLGQRKALLSEKLKQRQEQELGEVEKLAQSLLETLRSDLQERISGELNTTVTAIKDEIEDLPQQITDSTEPLKEVLEQARSEGEALKLVSSVWFKATLLGMFCGVGLLMGSWFGMSWIWDQIEQDMGTLRTLRQEIISAQSTLDELPKGVSYVKGRNGTGYLIARKIGTPYKTEAGKMAVEVR
ncbi:DUF1640 domain-containing protein [Aeromonas salmonicida]|uniref:DUF1640 domain-containing protein n=1 Tax=Aeromonas salmonicida TaxID=645 RepID=UPI002240AAC4|nr:DUF1640 domain-containing protein [Aeromonas salmonicida]MDF8327036.1 DUF1640 domain-containing protein [Aeromonas salmonicida]